MSTRSMSDTDSESESEQQYPTLAAVQAAFKKVVNVPPYCTGTVQLTAPQSLLFYRHNDEARVIDFANPSEIQLKALADACAPASFGRNQEDVVDENYRKAGKLDATEFSVQFSPWDSGVLKTIVESLFRSKNRSIANIAVQLYKLNVYGPGSFFKTHVDTPRSDTMFGSLVVVLPTPHTGGSLLFQHHQTEYSFDSAAAVSDSSDGNGDKPLAAFAAFFSDVKHEVAEVTDGYRITLTYNLYHATRNARDLGNVLMTEPQNVEVVQDVLVSFLSNPDFLPDGGLLAFGLSYEYPFNYHSTSLSDIGGRLKGIDALVMQVCIALKLEVSVKAVYHGEDHTDYDGVYCFMDYFVHFEHDQVDRLIPYLCGCDEDAIVGYDEHSDESASDYDFTEAVEVVWAKPLDGRNAFDEPYISYGNEPSMDCAYGQVCLLASIKPVSQRL